MTNNFFKNIITRGSLWRHSLIQVQSQTCAQVVDAKVVDAQVVIAIGSKGRSS